MKALTGLQNSFDQKIETLNQYLQSLSVRERVMVIFTTVFLVVVIIGFALWKMHALAEQQQKRLNELKDLTVWMQSNAATMKPANDLELSAARLGAEHRAFVGVYVRALCAAQHLCRGAERPVEQTRPDAGVRLAGGAEYRCGAGAAERPPPACGAPLYH